MEYTQAEEKIKSIIDFRDCKELLIKCRQKARLVHKRADELKALIKEIQTHSFNRSYIGGYNPKNVDSFLLSISKEIEAEEGKHITQIRLPVL